VDFPIKNGDLHSYVKLPEGIHIHFLIDNWIRGLPPCQPCLIAWGHLTSWMMIIPGYCLVEPPITDQRCTKSSKKGMRNPESIKTIIPVTEAHVRSWSNSCEHVCIKLSIYLSIYLYIYLSIYSPMWWYIYIYILGNQTWQWKIHQV